MCGIAGYFTRDSRGIAPETLTKTLSMLYNRGPDDYGFLSCRGAHSYLGRDVLRQLSGATRLLIHRRLAILDLSNGGWQPMECPQKRYCLVFNGEIYNYLELRTELESLGHRFSTTSDTEVLLAAYCEWQADAFAKLTGMFAVAILDRHEETITLARDPFGIKPLYYTNSPHVIAFASTIDVLLENAPISRLANPERLFLYLRYGVSSHGGETLFRDVAQLPPAHYMTARLREFVLGPPQRYWRLECGRSQDIHFDEAREQVRQVFLKNVGLHLRCDVPLGAALSGGIDSSSIVCAMRHLQGRDRDIHTVSYVPDDQSVSEQQWIDLINRATGATPHLVRDGCDNILQHIDATNDSDDEPIGGAGVYAQHCVFRRAREQNLKVMLDGQGADELLGGYRVFLGARLTSLVRQNRFPEAWRFLRHCSRLPDASTFSIIAAAVDHMLPAAWQAPFRMLVRQQVAPPWLNLEWFQKVGCQPSIVNYNASNNTLRHSLAKSVDGPGLGHLLRYEDRNSMAYSIESRVPFLTPEFASLMLSLPEEYLISPRGRSKHIFREAMRGIVPDAVLDRKDKLGFTTPRRHWLRALAPRIERALASEAAHRIPALRLDKLENEWRRIKTEHRVFDNLAWRWLNVIQWSQRFAVQY